MWEYVWDLRVRPGAVGYPKGGVAPLRHDLALFDYIQNSRARLASSRAVWPRAESAVASAQEKRHDRAAFRFTAILWNRP
jgi:hypothetical protein